MPSSFDHSRAHVLAASLLAIACLGLLGCGDSGDEASGPAGGGGEAQVATDAPTTDAADAGGRDAQSAAERREQRAGGAVVDDVYDDIAEAARAGVAATDVPVTATLETAKDNPALTRLCDLMTERAQRQTIVYAERSAGLADIDWNCERATGLLLRRARQSGGLKHSLKATVVGVTVDGNRATATVRAGRSGPTSTIQLVKEDGKWKLAATPGS